MIIDGHAHSCGEFYEAQSIVPLLDKLKVDKIVLCPGVKNEAKGYKLLDIAKVFPRADIMLNTNRIIKLISKPQTFADLKERNQYVYSLYSQYPDRIIQFYWVDPNNNDLLNDLHSKYSHWGYKGIKLHQCFQRFDSNSDGVNVIASFARNNKIPVFIHLYSKSDVHKFVDTVRVHKETNFIVAHLIGLEIFIEKAKGLKNLYFDISPTPLISSRRIELAIQYFGADKVILGSDTPFGHSNLRKNIERVNKLKISENEKGLILGENLQRLLNL